MRVYKLLNKYIDLDHVLAVDELSSFQAYTHSALHIRIWMAFRDKPLLVHSKHSFPDAVDGGDSLLKLAKSRCNLPGDTKEEQLERWRWIEKEIVRLFHNEYECFLLVWKGAPVIESKQEGER